MSETFHEYDFPDDQSVHWYALIKELHEGANTTRFYDEVTCPGCRSWMNKSDTALAKVGGPMVFLCCTHPPGSRTCSICTLEDDDESSGQAVAARALKSRRYSDGRIYSEHDCACRRSAVLAPGAGLLVFVHHEPDCKAARDDLGER